MMKPKVLITCMMAPEALKKIKLFAEIKIKSSLSKKQLLKEVKDIDAVILGTDNFDRELINSATRLKIIARFGVGYNNVDIKSSTRKKIFVTYTPNVLSDAVADLTVGFILAFSRKIIQANDHIKTGNWNENAPFPLGSDLKNKTLGIIGLGRIGIKVAERVCAFNMRLIYFSRTRKNRIEEKYGIKFRTFKNLLKESDYISINVPLTKETERMIGKEEFKFMKKTAFLINTARGDVIDQQSLHQALRNKRIAGAGLDVFQQEPIPLNDPILKLQNVILTPHIGSGTVETRLSMSLMAVNDVIRVLEGKRPIHLINKDLVEN
ncbi:MAG: D-glycerate dehydrogenase [Candidatus Bathyarchaeota archaeon]|nr:D-glycerate dehydrogenase [Candidatus Bathyarchaeota archaeon]